MAERKIQDGEKVLLPNGKRAVIESAWNLHRSGSENEPDGWTYHVSSSGEGSEGRLNYKEQDLEVLREYAPGHFSYQKP